MQAWGDGAGRRKEGNWHKKEETMYTYTSIVAMIVMLISKLLSRGR